MLIVDILAMYTKPRDIIEEGKDNPGRWAPIGISAGIIWSSVLVRVDLSQNSWCLMLKEVFEHTLSAPHVSWRGSCDDHVIITPPTFFLSRSPVLLERTDDSLGAPPTATPSSLGKRKAMNRITLWNEVS